MFFSFKSTLCVANNNYNDLHGSRIEQRPLLFSWRQNHYKIKASPSKHIDIFTKIRAKGRSTKPECNNKTNRYGHTFLKHNLNSGECDGSKRPKKWTICRHSSYGSCWARKGGNKKQSIASPVWELTILISWPYNLF